MLYDAAQIDRQTTLRYDSELELAMAAEQLPAWSSNRMARLVQLPKRISSMSRCYKRWSAWMLAAPISALWDP